MIDNLPKPIALYVEAENTGDVKLLDQCFAEDAVVRDENETHERLGAITEFFFPFHGFTPAIGLGIISLPFLALTIFARYSRGLARAWRGIYVAGAVICLYFNLFVLVVQSFEKIPALHALAPTQTESPFKLTQLVVLTISALLCIVALIRFRPEPARVT